MVNRGKERWAGQEAHEEGQTEDSHQRDDLRERMCCCLGAVLVGESESPKSWASSRGLNLRIKPFTVPRVFVAAFPCQSDSG